MRNRFCFVNQLFPVILALPFFLGGCFNAHLPPISSKNNTVTEWIYPEEMPIAEQPPATNDFSKNDAWDTTETDVSYIRPDRKLIALTFDDAPSSQLENLLAVFAEYNDQNTDCKATATIFCNGIRFDENTPQILHTALAMGMELGNHTYSHYDLTTLTATQKTSEIEQTDALLFPIDGRRRHLLRAPYGKINDEVKQAANAPIIDWSIDTLDWTGASVQNVFDSVFENKFPGAIVLMHDGYPHTRYALKRLLPALKAAGYQAVSVSAMAKMHGCALRNGKVYVRARKQKNP